MMNWLVSHLINSPLLAVVLGPIVTAIGNAGQRGITAYDKLPAIGKQFAAVGIAMVLVLVAHALPGVVPESCGSIVANGLSTSCADALTSSTFLTAVLTGLIAIAVKHGQQNTKSSKK